jgi:hypothetical protein
VDTIHLIQEKVQWQAPVKAVMSLLHSSATGEEPLRTLSKRLLGSQEKRLINSVIYLIVCLFGWSVG